MIVKEKILWWLFGLETVILGGNLVNNVFIRSFFFDKVFEIPILLIPVIFLFLHSSFSLGLSRGLVFIFLTSFIGLIFEVAGLNYGVVFGGHYVYLQSKLTILNVPLSVLFFWSVFIYTSYSITNSFLFWLKKGKPVKNISPFYRVIVFAGIDAIFTVIIDLVMDPIQVKIGAWKWLEGGTYFNIPIGNFIGWFEVAFIAMFLFRCLEYFYPKKINIDQSVFIMPVLGYGLMSLTFISLAYRYDLMWIILLSSILMLPVVVANIHLFFKLTRL